MYCTQLYIWDTVANTRYLVDGVRIDGTRELNELGFFTLDVPANHKQFNVFKVWNRITLRASDSENNINSWTVFDGLIMGYTERLATRLYDCAQTDNISFFGHSLNTLLDKAVIAYPAQEQGSGVSTINPQIPSFYKSYKQGAVDKMMCEFVHENIGAGANNNFRGDGTANSQNVISNLTVDFPTLTSATTWEGGRSYDDLLETIQKMGKWGAIDFEVLGSEITANGFIFKTYQNQRGRDLRYINLQPNGQNSSGNYPLRLSTNLENVLINERTETYIDAISKVHVLGAGAGINRKIITVVNSDLLSKHPLMAKEVSHDARNEDTDEALRIAGEEILTQNKNKISLKFEIVETAVLRFGRELQFGDTFSVIYKNELYHYKLSKFKFTIDADGFSYELIPEFIEFG